MKRSVPLCERQQSDTPDPRLYRVYLSIVVRSIRCLVGGYEGRATTHTNLWIHFIHCHVRNTVLILVEYNCPHSCYLACDIFVTWAALKLRHPVMGFYSQGAEKKRNCLV